MAACRRGTAPTPRLIPAALELGIALQDGGGPSHRQPIRRRRPSTTPWWRCKTPAATSIAPRRSSRHDRQRARRPPCRQSKPNGRRASPPRTTPSPSTARSSSASTTLYRAARQPSASTREQLRLLERTHDQFVRAGAAATPEQQARLGAINEELSAKFADFGRRLLADENTAIFITPRSRSRRPAATIIRDALRAAAVERGQPDAWAVVNTRSSVDPFLTFSIQPPPARAGLDARSKTAATMATPTTPTPSSPTSCACAPNARTSSASQPTRICAWPTPWRTTPERAQDLMMRVWPAAVARVHEEVADMQAIANRQYQSGRQHHHRAVGLPSLRRASPPRPLQSRSE